MTAHPKHVHHAHVQRPPQPRRIVLAAGQAFDAQGAEVPIELVDATAAARLTTDGNNIRIGRRYGFLPAPAHRIVNHGPGTIRILL